MKKTLILFLLVIFAIGAQSQTFDKDQYDNQSLDDVLEVNPSSTRGIGLTNDAGDISLGGGDIDISYDVNTNEDRFVNIRGDQITVRNNYSNNDTAAYVTIRDTTFIFFEDFGRGDDYETNYYHRGILHENAFDEYFTVTADKLKLDVVNVQIGQDATGTTELFSQDNYIYHDLTIDETLYVDSVGESGSNLVISKDTTSINGDLIINGKLDVVNTTDQLILKYDNSNYANFQVTSIGNFTVMQSGENFNLYDGVGAKVFRIFDSTTEKVRLSSYDNSYINGGNVGINTTTPTQKLEVNGNVVADEANADNQLPTLGQVKELIAGVSDSLYLGKFAYGGYIFYLNGDSTSGLVAYESSIGGDTGYAWDNSTGGTTGATGTSLFTGQSNTTTIISALGSAAEAASACDDLVVGAYSDYYLGSIDELDSIYNVLYLNGIGNYQDASAGHKHWASTEVSATTARVMLFYDGTITSATKTATTAAYVIPVRSFTIGTDAAGVQSLSGGIGVVVDQSTGNVAAAIALSELSDKTTFTGSDKIAAIVGGNQGLVEGSTLAAYIGDGSSDLSTTYNTSSVTINNTNGDGTTIAAATDSQMGVVKADGTTITSTAGVLSVIGGGSGGDEAFQTLTSSTTVTWDFDTSKNANLTIANNVGTLTISNHDNGERGTLFVTPSTTTNYTIDFGSLKFVNGHSDTFTIEASSTITYIFTLTYNGSITVVDYVTAN